MLLDDFHMVPAHLQSYFYALLLERRLGNFKLADNIAIVLTMNDSDLAGFNGINAAVRNRLAILPIEFNFDYWLDTYGNRLHYLVASFLKAKPHFCIEDETTTIEGYASARAWTALANELNFHDEEFITKHAAKLVNTQVSNTAAQAFQTHVNYVAAIDFKGTVKSRTVIQLAKRDPLDAIIFSYIVNFINTVQDGTYLFELMSANKNESAFIGFLFGELLIKYSSASASNAEPISEGIKFVIDRLINIPMDPSKYPNTDKAALSKAFNTQLDDLAKFKKIGQEYLL